ncbi:hypothetical protein RhiLY_07203 [Ceratobasidium sp. AG-Ba]|nr:hypothetical protein RhiLY_07203 [Ceratobasidium sp. AG-Ba]
MAAPQSSVNAKGYGQQCPSPTATSHPPASLLSGAVGQPRPPAPPLAEHACVANGEQPVAHPTALVRASALSPRLASTIRSDGANLAPNPRWWCLVPRIRRRSVTSEYKACANKAGTLAAVHVRVPARQLLIAAGRT